MLLTTLHVEFCCNLNIYNSSMVLSTFVEGRVVLPFTKVNDWRVYKMRHTLC